MVWRAHRCGLICMHNYDVTSKILPKKPNCLDINEVIKKKILPLKNTPRSTAPTEPRPTLSIYLSIHLSHDPVLVALIPGAWVRFFSLSSLFFRSLFVLLACFSLSFRSLRSLFALFAVCSVSFRSLFALFVLFSLSSVALGSLLGPSWPLLGPSWTLLDASGALLGAPWALLGVSGMPLGPSGVPLGLSAVPLSRSGGALWDPAKVKIGKRTPPKTKNVIHDLD